MNIFIRIQLILKWIAYLLFFKKPDRIIIHKTYVGNCAVDIGERVRTTIFSVALRRFFVGEKNWSWSFALTFFVTFFRQGKKVKEHKFLNKLL